MPAFGAAGAPGCDQVAPASFVTKTPTGSGAVPVPDAAAYATWTPAGFGGLAGGASATTTLPIPPPAPAAVETAAGAARILCAQFAPPSAERKPPCPLTPAQRTRAPTGVDVSSTRLSAMPARPAPRVQFSPPSAERNTPTLEAM